MHFTSYKTESLVFDFPLQLLCWLIIKMFPTLICLPWTSYFIEKFTSYEKLNTEKKCEGRWKRLYGPCRLLNFLIDQQRHVNIWIMSEWTYSALITKNGKLSKCNTFLKSQRCYMNCVELNRDGPHGFSHWFSNRGCGGSKSSVSNMPWWG